MYICISLLIWSTQPPDIVALILVSKDALNLQFGKTNINRVPDISEEMEQFKIFH